MELRLAEVGSFEQFALKSPISSSSSSAPGSQGFKGGTYSGALNVSSARTNLWHLQGTYLGISLRTPFRNARITALGYGGCSFGGQSHGSRHGKGAAELAPNSLPTADSCKTRASSMKCYALKYSARHASGQVEICASGHLSIRVHATYTNYHHMSFKEDI